MVGQLWLIHQISCFKLGLELSNGLLIEKIHSFVMNRAIGLSPGDLSILEFLVLNEKDGGSRTAPSCIPMKGSKDLGLLRAL